MVGRFTSIRDEWTANDVFHLTHKGLCKIADAQKSEQSRMQHKIVEYIPKESTKVFV